MKRSVGAFALLRLLDQPDDAGDGVVGAPPPSPAPAATPSPLTVPAKTASPGALRLGTLSPVTGASSTALSPSRIVAVRRDAVARAAPGWSRRPRGSPPAPRAVAPSRSSRAVSGTRPVRPRMLARARPAATPSSTSPTRNRNTTVAASSVAPMSGRADGGDRSSASRWRTACRAGPPTTARRAIGTRPTAMAARKAQRSGRRRGLADGVGQHQGRRRRRTPAAPLALATRPAQACSASDAVAAAGSSAP